MDERFQILAAGFSVGLTLIVLGVQRALLSTIALVPRLALGGGSVLISGLVAFGLTDWRVGTLTVVATSTFFVVLAARDLINAGMCWTVRLFQRPGYHAAVQIVAGLILIVGGLGWWDQACDAELAAQDKEMLAVGGSIRPPLHVLIQGQTDAGRPVDFHAPDDSDIEGKPLAAASADQFFDNLIRTSDDSELCNCFGWVFTGGRYWISDETVEHIIEDNGYKAMSDPQPGDAVIYRKDGKIIHAAIVKGNSAGVGVLVEGKWGRRGVFVHIVDRSGYGSEYTFYRSARPGHVLQGL